MLLRIIGILYFSTFLKCQQLPDFSVPDFSCPEELMRKSAAVPNNVNAVRPADIKIIMALGDSLTAGNGAAATELSDVKLQYRGLSFGAGGDKSLEQHATLPNILKKFNPDLFGYSNGIGSQNVWNVAHFNGAIPGAHASMLSQQARSVIALLQAHIDNDTPTNCVEEIEAAIRIFYENVPRVLVSVSNVLHLEMLRKLEEHSNTSKQVHRQECDCVNKMDTPVSNITQTIGNYNTLERRLMESGEFEKDDFTVVIQPFFANSTQPPLKDGIPDLSFFAPDCFHFSQKGHAVISTHLWKNLMQPVGRKSTQADFSMPAVPLACPDKECPYIRTKLNSADSLALLVSCTFSTLPDYGISNYSCPEELMKKSKHVPKNVNSVRPADIKVVMALGDSLTAANGAGAEDPLAVILQYRGLAFQAGGDKGLENHVTIPNILKKYNPNLFGYSNGIGSPNVWEVAKLNVAMPGANAKDLPGQARTLVSLLHEHKESVDFNNDWKLLNIFIGGNDICGFCRHEDYNPYNCGQKIKEAVQIIYDNVPRVIVSLTGMLHLEMLRTTDEGHYFCKRLHKDECGCEGNKNFTNAEIAQACDDYNKYEKQIETDGTFEKDDFTYVVQPFFSKTVVPPMKPDQTFFAPDCFHFSQWGHAVVSTHLWNNLLEPVGGKATTANISAPAADLACPDATCPFIRTPKNSQDCSKYMTPAA
ncbi:unnamed protein product [Caenorhabditis bovis]|uniref:Phospholipase B1, membrane-associated n=1 Tax=Caenorhabditis bovis TaxID=2654633 RepID=A0A8S1F3U3_9PELO|nr:unnamed protein product [Caenorhabditis bovis]